MTHPRENGSELIIFLVQEENGILTPRCGFGALSLILVTFERPDITDTCMHECTRVCVWRKHGKGSYKIKAQNNFHALYKACIVHHCSCHLPCSLAAAEDHAFLPAHQMPQTRQKHWSFWPVQ